MTRSGRRHARSFELMTFFDFVLYVLRKGQLNRHAQGMYFCLIRRQGGFCRIPSVETTGQINNNKGVGTPRVHSVIVLTSPDYHLPGPVGRGPRRSPEGHDWLRLVRARQIRYIRLLIVRRLKEAPQAPPTLPRTESGARTRRSRRRGRSEFFFGHQGGTTTEGFSTLDHVP